MINVALIGKGYWGKNLGRYISENPHFYLKRICDSKSDMYNDVYRDSELDAVVVAAPNGTHYGLAKASLSCGKHVLCEKPLAFSDEECRNLAAISRENGLSLTTDYTYTFSPSLSAARKLVEDGRIGNIKKIEMCMKQPGRTGRGDVYWILGSHMLSILDVFVPLGDLGFQRKDLLTYGREIESGKIDFGNMCIDGEISVSLVHPGKERQVALYGDTGTIVYNPLAENPLQVSSFGKQKNHGKPGAGVNRESFHYDESNNLRHAVEYFRMTIEAGLEDNSERSSLVTRTLEQLYV